MPYLIIFSFYFDRFSLSPKNIVNTQWSEKLGDSNDTMFFLKNMITCNIGIFLIMYCINWVEFKDVCNTLSKRFNAMDKIPSQRLASAFKTKKCWMIQPLAEKIDYSIPSARRFLAKTGYYSSFTHNGKWYTLASIPRFGQNGLWFHKEIGFSKSGSLTLTLVDLIEKSPEGMTADQLGKLLRCRCHAVLVQLCRKGQLQRQKYDRSYVYLSIDPCKAAEQTGMRRDQALSPLTSELAVLVLVEFIRTSGAEPDVIAQTISQRIDTTIRTEQVQRLFEEHDLKKMA